MLQEAVNIWCDTARREMGAHHSLEGVQWQHVGPEEYAVRGIGYEGIRPSRVAK